MSSNFTVPGFAGDDYEDDAPVALAEASPDMIVSGWPECEFTKAEEQETLPMAA